MAKTVEDLMEELAESVQTCAQYRRTLERTADRLAEIGLIDSHPHAKRLFIDGRREL